MPTAAEKAEAIAAARGGVGKRKYIRDVFTRIAPRYDLLNHIFSLNIDKGWRRDAVAALEVERDPRGVYLDLCAGTLDMAINIARVPGFSGMVIGADFAEPMLRYGLRKRNTSRIRAAVADALQLPLRSESVSGAVVAFGVRNVTDLRASFEEVRRVLKPGGRFAILEFSVPTTPILNGAYRFYFHKVIPVVGTIVSGHETAYRYLPQSVDNFPTRDELARQLAAARFARVRWRQVTFGIAAIHVGERPASRAA